MGEEGGAGQVCAERACVAGGTARLPPGRSRLGGRGRDADEALGQLESRHAGGALLGVLLVPVEEDGARHRRRVRLPSERRAAPRQCGGGGVELLAEADDEPVRLGRHHLCITAVPWLTATVVWAAVGPARRASRSCARRRPRCHAWRATRRPSRRRAVPAGAPPGRRGRPCLGQKRCCSRGALRPTPAPLAGVKRGKRPARAPPRAAATRSAVRITRSVRKLRARRTRMRDRPRATCSRPAGVKSARPREGGAWRARPRRDGVEERARIARRHGETVREQRGRLPVSHPRAGVDSVLGCSVACAAWSAVKVTVCTALVCAKLSREEACSGT